MEILARGVGRRKEAVAQVQIVKGTGQFLINNIPAQQYLHNNTCSMLSVKAPLTSLISLTASTENITNPTKQIEKNTNSTLAESNKKDNLQLNTLNKTEISEAHGVNIANSVNFEHIDTFVKVKGGGLAGQAEAIKLGLARALCSLTTTNFGISEEEVRKELKDKGYLTQDSRVKERRKCGLKKARKATQYNKR